MTEKGTNKTAEAIKTANAAQVAATYHDREVEKREGREKDSPILDTATIKRMPVNCEAIAELALEASAHSATASATFAELVLDALEVWARRQMKDKKEAERKTPREIKLGKTHGKVASLDVMELLAIGKKQDSKTSHNITVDALEAQLQQAAQAGNIPEVMRISSEIAKLAKK